MVQVYALVGSADINDYTHDIVRFMMKRHEFLEGILTINGLSYFHEDLPLDPNDLPTEVKQFKKQIKSADGLLIMTPEYNRSIPGVLKNALDWCSRVGVELRDKPVMIAGASNDEFRTIQAQIHLREILTSPRISAHLLKGWQNEIFISNVASKIDHEGNIKDELTISLLDSVFENFISFINGNLKKQH